MQNVIQYLTKLIWVIALTLVAALPSITYAADLNDAQMIIWEQEADTSVAGAQSNFFVYVTDPEQGTAMLVLLAHAAKQSAQNADLEDYQIVNWVILKQEGLAKTPVDYGI